MKDLTKADRYHEVMQQWKQATHSLGTGFIIMGKCLSELKREQLWKLDGNQNITFRYWVEGELKICYSQAMRLIQVYERVGKYLDNPDLQGIDIYKIVLLLPHMKGKTDDEVITMLYDAKECSVRALKNNILEQKGLPTTDTCDHSKYGQIIWCQCENCKGFYKG